MKFSVLMTTWKGEKPEYLQASLDSILVNQTLLPTKLVLVIDGPIPEELDAVVKDYEQRFANVVVTVRLAENVGQSKASAAGIPYIETEIFARMDSDDICLPNRFEKEYEYLINHPEVSVVGGWINEFETDPSVVCSVRQVPQEHEEITKMFKNRTPINNVTAMMRMEALVKAGGYGRDTVNEDYSVYAHMWVNGCKFYNIQEALVNVRVGNGMTSRRSDFRIYKDWKKDQIYLYKNKKESWLQMKISCFKCFMFVVMPAPIKNFLYKHVLRKKA